MSAWLPADWAAPDNVRAFTTLRTGPGVSLAPFDRFNLGSRCGDDPDAVASNRAALIGQAGLPAAPHWLRQVHGTQVVRFGDQACDDVPAAARTEVARMGSVESDPAPSLSAGVPQAREAEADAAVTSAVDTVLAVLTADCLPVVFAADDGSEVAVAHAGWRGLAAGVLEHTVAAMRAPPARLLAWFGPAAGPQAYEVGEEVFTAFVSQAPHAEDAFAATRPGHWHVDLYALAQLRLASAGVDRVSGGGLCTIADPARFYSHRRDCRSGRMATLVYRIG